MSDQNLIQMMADMILGNPSVLNKLKLVKDEVSYKKISDALTPVAYALMGMKLTKTQVTENMSDSYGGMVRPMAMRRYSVIPKLVESRKTHYNESIPLIRQSLFDVKEFVWEWYEYTGLADYTSEMDGNSQRAETIVHEENGKVHSHSIEYELSMNELYAAIHNNWPIALSKALGAAKGKKMFIHNTLINGSKKGNQPGLYTHPLVVADNATGIWKTNPEKMRADLGFSIGEVSKLTFGNHAIDTIHLPPSLYQELLGTDINLYDPKPMFHFLTEHKAMYGIKNVEIRQELETASSVGGRSVMLYEKTEECLEGRVDEVGETFPQVIDPERILIKAKGYAADLQFHYPKSARMIEAM